MHRPRLRPSGIALLPLTVLFVIGFWLANPLLALAHARLLTSNPVPGASLETSPSDIEFSFSEPVSLEFSSIKIYDRARREQPVGPAERGAGGDTTVKAGVTQPLQPGVYTVVWRVISGADGHVTAGSFAFRVRAAGATQGSTPEPAIDTTLQQSDTGSPFEGSSDNPDPFRWSIRALILITSSVLLGGSLFTVLILEPTADDTGKVGASLWPLAGSRFGRVGAWAAAILVVALALDLLAQVATVGATGLLEALSRSDLASVLLSSTRYGFAWSMKAIAAGLLFLMMLFVWLVSKRGGNGIWEIAIAVGSLFLLAESLSSHAAGVEGGQLLGLPAPLISDWLHLVTAAAWVGGLVYMGLVLFPAFGKLRLSHEERLAFLGRSVPRFSIIAVLSVVTLAATGTYNLLTHSNDLGAILGSGYGQVLLIKHILLVALLGIGAVNLLRLSPQLRSKMPGVKSATATSESLTPGSQPPVPTSGPVWQLRRNVRAEIVLLGLVLVCAGGLTLLPPPSASGTTYAAAGAGVPVPGESPTAMSMQPEPSTVAPSPVTASTHVGGYGLDLTARTSSEGDEFSLDLRRDAQTASPLTDVLKVVFKVTPQDIDAGSASYVGERQGLGGLGADRQTWRAIGPILTLDGTYLVNVTVQRTQSRDLKAAFKLELSEERGLHVSEAQVVDLRLSTEPSPPISGTATLKLALVDGSGAPITDAKVTVSPLMPAHAHVEPSGPAVPVPGSPGTFTFPVHFTMGGSWLILFDVEHDDQPIIKA
ncbi:MAG: copper resistance protein CopC, partial [Chloroflexota bacterium]|nr:copper resistance protein CopC [Chloroflexota bacterium]